MNYFNRSPTLFLILEGAYDMIYVGLVNYIYQHPALKPLFFLEQGKFNNRISSIHL